jgi:hypothetical protein
MIRTTIGLIFAQLIAVQAWAVAPSKDYMQRLQKQMGDITPVLAGANPVADDVYVTMEAAWDPTQFNPNRMIRLTKSDTNTLIGLGDPERVAKMLGSKFKPVI